MVDMILPQIFKTPRSIHPRSTLLWKKKLTLLDFSVNKRDTVTLGLTIPKTDSHRSPLSQRLQTLSITKPRNSQNCRSPRYTRLRNRIQIRGVTALGGS